MGRLSFCLTALAAILLPATGKGDSVDIPASAASKFASSGQHNYPFDTNYLAGTIAFSDTYRSYFIFDLAALPANHIVTAAELLLEMPSGGYLSPDASETYTLFDVTTNVAAFGQSYSAGDLAAQAIYADLGTGASLGSVSVSDADELSVVAVALSAAGIDWINQAGAGMLVIGGAPEPSSLLLASVAACALAALVRRRR
jgi:hypothetical protein